MCCVVLCCGAFHLSHCGGLRCGVACTAVLCCFAMYRLMYVVCCVLCVVLRRVVSRPFLALLCRGALCWCASQCCDLLRCSSV